MTFKIKNEGIDMHTINDDMYILISNTDNEPSIYITPNEGGLISFDLIRNNYDIEQLTVNSDNIKVNVKNETTIQIQCANESYIKIEFKFKKIKCKIMLTNIYKVTKELEQNNQSVDISTNNIDNIQIENPISNQIEQNNQSVDILNNNIDNNQIENPISNQIKNQETNFYVKYIVKNELELYIRNTKNVYANNIIKGGFYNKNSNYFDVDSFFYNNINRLNINTDVELHRHINDIGIELGLIYHPKQLLNIFPDIHIYQHTINKNIYFKKSNSDEYINAHEFLINNLYNKDFEWYINSIEMKHNTLSDNKLLLIVFIGDERVGTLLIKKIINYKKIQNFALGIVFRNEKLYMLMNQIIIDNFTNFGIFISKEYGADIIPSLQAFWKISKLIQFKKIIKLHTKSSDNTWFTNATDYLLNKPEVNLEQLEIIEKSKKLCNCVNNIIYLHKDGDNKINKKILDKYRNNLDKPKFIRGTMFYCDRIVLDKTIDLIKLDWKMFFNNTMYELNCVVYTNSPIHAVERIFGMIKIT